jgi:hypothetical protein
MSDSHGIVWKPDANLDLSNADSVASALGGKVFPGGITDVTSKPIVRCDAFAVIVLPYKSLIVTESGIPPHAIYHNFGQEALDEVRRVSEHFNESPIIVSCKELMSRKTFQRALVDPKTRGTDPRPFFIENEAFYVQTSDALRLVAALCTHSKTGNEQARRSVAAELQRLLPNKSISKFRNALDILRHPLIHLHMAENRALGRAISERARLKASP